MKTTKKPRSVRAPRQTPEGLGREYRFDYKKSRPNRFAREIGSDAVVIVLDADVAKVFHDSKRVNALLRATISAVNRSRTSKAG